MHRSSLALTLLLLLPALSGCIGNQATQAEPDETPPPHPLSASTFTWDPFFPSVGTSVRFEPSIQSSISGDALRGLKWTMEGTTYTDSRPIHAFSRAGAQDVTLVIQTEQGGRYEVHQTVDVTDAAGRVPASPDPATDPTTQPRQTAPIISWNLTQSTAQFQFRFSGNPEQILWDFGDGTRSTEAAPNHTYTSIGDFTVNLRLLTNTGVATASTNLTIDEVPYLPHVLVAVPDTGINPYHESFRRPALRSHPCTYIRDFPCDIPALELTLDAADWQTAFQADKAKWQAIKPGDWYWIPGTVFVAVHCDGAYLAEDGNLCILDDTHMHGTGTVSSVLMENPAALIAFKEYDPDISTFSSRGIPVDVYSVSWGASAPVAGTGWTPAFPAGTCPWDVPDQTIYVKSSGNEPGLTVLADCWSGNPRAISVGGAYAADRSQEPLAYKDMDVVSYFCRPTAQTKSLDQQRQSYCGTSFAAPTVAGALSKVVLGLRQSSGYTGTTVNGVVDPILGITVADIRDAMERTASFNPQAEYPNNCFYCPPANPVAPWLQWGWGFYDGRVAETTLADLLGTADGGDKSSEARTYLETQYEIRKTLYG